jgi:hypothetical protein
MRCKDVRRMKRKLERLEKENLELKRKVNAIDVLGERRHPFNCLEIVVRPLQKHFMLGYDYCDIDLRVVGNDQFPAIATVKRIELTSLDIIRGNKADFIRCIGEIMAKELLEFGRKT